MLVVFREVRELFKDVLCQFVDAGARVGNSVVCVEEHDVRQSCSVGLVLFGFSLISLASEHLDAVLLQLDEEVNRVIQLVQASLDAALRRHRADDGLGLLGADAEHAAHLRERDVQVDLGEHLNIVFEGRLEQAGVAITVSRSLVLLEVILLERNHFFPLDDVVEVESFEDSEVGRHRLAPFVFVELGQYSELPVSRWRKDGGSQGRFEEQIDHIGAFDRAHIGGPIILPGGELEITPVVLHDGLLPLVPDLEGVLARRQQVDDAGLLEDPALGIGCLDAIDIVLGDPLPEVDLFLSLLWVVFLLGDIRTDLDALEHRSRIDVAALIFEHFCNLSSEQIVLYCQNFFTYRVLESRDIVD